MRAGLLDVPLRDLPLVAVRFGFEVLDLGRERELLLFVPSLLDWILLGQPCVALASRAGIRQNLRRGALLLALTVDI